MKVWKIQIYYLKVEEIINKQRKVKVQLERKSHLIQRKYIQYHNKSLNYL